MRRAQRSHEVARLGAQAFLVRAQLADALRETAVRLLPDALDSLELVVHPLERVLQRPDVARQPSVGELEEPRAVGLERLGRDPRDRRRGALVEGPLTRCDLGSGLGELPLEGDHLLHAPSALDEGRAHDDEDADGADEQPD